MRPPVVMMQGQVEQKMQRRRPGQRHGPARLPPRRQRQKHAPDEKGVIDQKDRLPQVGIVKLPKDHAPRQPLDIERKARHQIERQVGQQRPGKCRPD